VCVVRPLVAIVSVVALGCASSTPQPNTGALRDVSQTENGQIIRTTPDYAIQSGIPLPVDEAYAAMMVGYSRLGIPTTTSDEGHHVLGNGAYSVTHRFRGENLSRFFECGRDGLGVPRADRYELTVSVMSSLAPDGPQNTKVQTLVTAKGSDPTGDGQDVYCSTTGHLEAELIDATRS
jgi:hypothetical protein